MKFEIVALFLSIAMVRADDDLELDDDVVPACREICRPIHQLTDRCDVDDDRVGGDAAAFQLQAQCVCTNRSFDVNRIAGLCQSCIASNPQGRDDDDLEDINRIVRVCGFATATFTPADATSVSGISVAATALSGTAQLTTTIANPVQTGTGGGSSSGGNGGGSDDDRSRTTAQTGGPTTVPSAGNMLAPFMGQSALGYLLGAVTIAGMLMG